MEHLYKDSRNRNDGKNKGKSNLENYSPGYITVNQFRLFTGLLLAFLVYVLSFLGLAAFIIRQHILAESSGSYTSGDWESWKSWIDCSVSCGKGTRVRVRQCDNSSNECTGHGIDLQMCYLRNCSAAGDWESWQSWIDCSVSCGEGTRARERHCDNTSGDCTGNKVDIQTCKMGDCTAHGIWKSWQGWTDCSASCGEGTRVRVRQCDRSHIECKGIGFDLQKCTIRKCSAAGEWTNWQRWTNCSASCGEGTRARVRQCDHNSNDCTGNSIELQKCSLGNCRTVDSCHTPTVVFSAKSPSTADVFERRALIFTTVTSNLGLGYNSNTGYFTTPYSGTYLFHTTVCAQGNKGVYVDLMAKGNSLVTTGTKDEDVNGTCTSASGVVVMSRGDQAWVQGALTEEVAVYYNVNHTYSTPTFSGVLLHKSCSTP